MNKQLKTILSKVALLLIPLLLIVGLECFLRYNGYRFQNTLFITEKLPDGQTSYFLNPWLKEKYQFTGRFDIYNPIYPDRMKLKKKPGDFRIFCMGGSTTQGYPYLINGSFPTFLEAMLQLAQTERDVEVVNLGVTAMNSHGVRDFIQMAPEYQPDLIVLYMGHNEFFGALGSASNLLGGENRHVVRAFLKLQEYKTYLLARDVYTYLKSLVRSPETEPSTLMTEIVRIKSIPVKSPLRVKTYDNFRQNLRDIIRISKKNNIPIIVSTVVSNTKDFKPFDFDKTNTENNANIYFQQGRALLKKGETKKALAVLTKAKDLDLIPFRAPSDINKNIRQVTSELNVPLVDMDLIMHTRSKQGVLGKPEIIEHLHPSFRGNYQIASQFAKAIFSSQLLRKKQKINWQSSATIEQVREHAGFTELDQYLGNYRVEYLMGKWPFNINNARYQIPPVDVDTTVVAVPRMGKPDRVTANDLSGMHRKLGSYYFEKNQYRMAYREYNAAYKLDSFNKQIEIEKAMALFYLYRGTKHQKKNGTNKQYKNK